MKNIHFLLTIIFACPIYIYSDIQATLHKPLNNLEANSSNHEKLLADGMIFNTPNLQKGSGIYCKEFNIIDINNDNTIYIPTPKNITHPIKIPTPKQSPVSNQQHQLAHNGSKVLKELTGLQRRSSISYCTTCR